MRTTFEANSTFWPDLWKAAYRMLRQKMTSEMISAWIDSLELEKIDENGPSIQVFFLAPNDFQYNWVKEKYLHFLADAFTQVAGRPCQIHLDVSQKEGADSHASGTHLSRNSETRESKEGSNSLSSSISSLKNSPSSRSTKMENPSTNSEKLTSSGESPNQGYSSSWKNSEQTLFSYLDGQSLNSGNSGNSGNAGNTSSYSGGEGHNYTDSGTYEKRVQNSTPSYQESASSRSSETISSGLYSVNQDSHQGYHQEYQRRDNSLDPKYDFASFIVGASNQFAHASAIAVAENPARQYNPLLIYSQSGLGKTHLLHAIGNYAKKKNPSLRVGYFSAETFVNDVIDSIKHNKMSDFRHKYRESFDLILMDDIQFLAGKERSEEEFFHTFNALHTTKRQVVVTSDRDPKDLDKLESRLRSRLGWGLVADIRPPEIETRIAILRAKADRDDIYLLDEVATYIATHIKTNVRELEGILVKLEAQASLSGSEISLEMAKQLLSHLIPEESSDFTVESIQNTVARFFGIKIVELRSSSRLKKIALGRQIAMFLIRRYTGLQYEEIGQHFGGRDHTTVMHSCKKIESSMETDSEIKELVEQIQNQL